MKHYLGTGVYFDKGKTPVDTRLGNHSFAIGNGELSLSDTSGLELPRSRDDQREIECALVLDLGNSRTAGLILDDFRCPNDNQFTFHIVPLSLSDYFSKETSESIVSDSVLVAEDSPLSSSCLRTGETAVKLEKIVRNNPDSFRYQFSFTSPKLSFWDGTRIDTAGPVSFARRKEGMGEKVELDVPPLERSGRLVHRSDLIGEMVVELLEQAESQINHWAENWTQGDIRRGWRRVSTVALTYPTCWTDEERDRYIKAIQTKIDEVWVRPNGLKGVSVVKTVDEATAVLLAFATNESQRSSANPNQAATAWLQTIGGLSSVRHGNPLLRLLEATFAVIDIGGGTTDIAVETISVDPTAIAGAGGNGVSLDEDGGICVAGNVFLQNVLESVILPQLFGELNGLDERLNAGDSFKANLVRNRNQRRRYCRTHFASLALSLVLYEKGKNGKPATATERARRKKDFTEKSLLPMMQDILGDYPDIGDPQVAAKKLADALLENDLSNRLRQVAENTFRENVIDPFVQILESRPFLDKILCSGKPFEIPAVKALFDASVPEKFRDRITFMSECRLSPYWAERYAGKFDVKLMTVIGGCVAFLQNAEGVGAISSFPNIGVPERNGETTRWKLVPLSDLMGDNHQIRFSNDEETIGPNHSEYTFYADGTEYGLVRRQGIQCMPAQVGFYLKRNTKNDDPVQVTLRPEAGKLVIEPLDPRDEGKITLEMHLDSGESNWTETGRIDFDKPFVQAKA